MVVWDKVDYFEEGDRQLGNSDVYEELDRDPTAELELEVKYCVTETQFFHVGLSEEAPYLQVQSSKGLFIWAKLLHLPDPGLASDTSPSYRKPLKSQFAFIWKIKLHSTLPV